MYTEPRILGMRTEHKNPQLNCQKLAEVFLSNPLIEDCYFMVREDELVAYIVSSGAWNSEQLSSDLQSQLPDNLLPNIYVQISSLPLTDSGDVDETALKNIEIIDDHQVQETEEKLRSLSDIDQVAAVMTSKKIKILPLHLSDLLPLKPEKKIIIKNLKPRFIWRFTLLTLKLESVTDSF
jgi:hypothetical protein